MLYFAGIICLLVEETNRYYHQHVDRRQDGPSPRPDVTESEKFLFLGIIIQMGHDNRGRLKDYWSTLEQFATPFYSKTMKRDRFLHILRFLHFDRNADSYDLLWKIRTIFDTLNDAFEKYYNPFEHLPIDKIIVKYKGRRTWKWTNKLFFHLLDLTILNSYILLSSCGAKLSHREFRLALVWNMLEHAGRGPPSPSTAQGSNPCRFIGVISNRGGQTTALVNFLYFEIEVSSVLFAWETNRPDKVREV
ncbi:hypothetical protein B7P43_G14961 [Cryptotermes secundus]|uniref:PiggyBac transposable element-derived protein domain-containing protein n=1 Tax=Cryptotermes secundus TaxID=105785 RepID=A0A2J7PDZ3_9NEOP|nr:hypothetical protein B7P43_G14961 [Cryptotermes secundus]